MIMAFSISSPIWLKLHNRKIYFYSVSIPYFTNLNLFFFKTCFFLFLFFFFCKWTELFNIYFASRLLILVSYCYIILSFVVFLLTKTYKGYFGSMLCVVLLFFNPSIVFSCSYFFEWQKSSYIKPGVAIWYYLIRNFYHHELCSVAAQQD